MVWLLLKSAFPSETTKKPKREEDTTEDVPAQRRLAWEGDGLAELVLLNRTGQTQVVARNA